MATKKTAVPTQEAPEPTAVPETPEAPATPKSTLTVSPVKVGKTTKIPTCQACGVKARQVPYFGIDFADDLRVVVCDACARRVRRQIRLARSGDDNEA